MSRIITRLRSRRSQGSEELENKETTPPKLATGFRRVILWLQLIFPLGLYQRGYTWIYSESEPPELTITEREFRARFIYFAVRSLTFSLGLAIAFTAPLSLPWITLELIPFTIQLLPFNIGTVILEVISKIVEQLAFLKYVFYAIQGLSAISGSYNPVMLYAGTLWLIGVIGLADTDPLLGPESFQRTDNESLVELMSINVQDSFPAMGGIIVPLLIVLFTLVSFFLVVNRTKKLFFELQPSSHTNKRRQKVLHTLMRYYGPVEEDYINYTPSQPTNPKLLSFLSSLLRYGPILVLVIPVGLAVVILLV